MSNSSESTVRCSSSDDPRIETLGHDSLAVSQESTDIGTGMSRDTLQDESQTIEMQGHHLEAVITDLYHLPECQLATSVYDDRADCICDELRACEQRVLGLRLDDLKVKSFNAALDEAEKAILELHYPLQNVTTLQWCSECSGFDGDEIEWPCRTVEQIRSLKEKP